jgi:hypothetical protein
MTEKQIDKYLKYLNLFTYLYLRYFRNKTKVSLGAVYLYTIKLSQSRGESISSWDVFDYMMWIFSIVFGIIIWGFLF